MSSSNTTTTNTDDFNSYNNDLPDEQKSNAQTIVNGSGTAEILSMIYVAFALVTWAYVAIFLAYLTQVVFASHFLYGYYRPELKPGPFTNDRFNGIWFFLMFGLFRGMIPTAILVVFQNVRLYITREMLFQFLRFCIFLDGIILVALGIMYCGFCNNCTYRNAVCDAPLSEYCDACWKEQPDICEPRSFPPIPSNSLILNNAYWSWLRWTGIFLGTDILLFIFLPILIRHLRYDYMSSVDGFGFSASGY